MFLASFSSNYNDEYVLVDFNLHFGPFLSAIGIYFTMLTKGIRRWNYKLSLNSKEIFILCIVFFFFFFFYIYFELASTIMDNKLFAFFSSVRVRTVHMEAARNIFSLYSEIDLCNKNNTRETGNKKKTEKHT